MKDSDDIIEIMAEAAYNDEWRHSTLDPAWENLPQTMTGDEIQGHWQAQARAVRAALSARGYVIGKRQRPVHEILGDQTKFVQLICKPGIG